MQTLINSVYALEKLQEQIDLATNELLQRGIKKIGYTYATFYKPNDTNNDVFAVVPPEHFPFHLATDCGPGKTVEPFHIDYEVFLYLKHIRLRTDLYYNERDFLLLTPQQIREKAIKDIEKEVREGSKHKKGIENQFLKYAAKNLQRLWQSIEGKKPKIKTYEYIPTSEEEKNPRRNEVIEDVATLKQLFRQYIDSAKNEVTKFGVNECKHVHISYLDGRISPVEIDTIPAYFPFSYATDIREDKKTPYTIVQFLTRALLKNIDITSSIPLQDKQLLLDLQPDLRRKVLKLLDEQIEHFRSKPHGIKEELLQKHPEIQQTLEFLEQLQQQI